MNRKRHKLTPGKNDVQKECQEAEIAALKRNLVDMEAKLKRVIAELEQVKEEQACGKMNFETEKCELESKIEKYKEQCTKLQNKNEKLESENEKLQSENKKLQKHLQYLEPVNIIVEERSQANLCNTDLNSQITKVKEQNDDTLGINSLPNEILLKIFAYLKHNQLGQIARVCKRWNILTRSPILWKKVDVEFSSSHESQTDIAKSFVNQLPPCVSCLSLHFGFYDDWKELLYFQKFCIKLKTKCPHLKRLSLDNVILSDTFPTVIDLCSRHLQNIQALKFGFCTAPDGPAKKKNNDALKIELLDVSCCHFGCNKLSFSRMPNLKWLFLMDRYVNDSWFENETSFFNQLRILDLSHTRISSRTFQAIRKHAFNLQELYLCFTDIKGDLSSNNSKFLQLKIVCFVYCDGVTSNDIVSFIQSCQSLQNVYVTQEVAESYAVHPSVVDNRYMLEIVKSKKMLHTHNFSHW